jgi:hypothetical protein
MEFSKPRILPTALERQGLLTLPNSRLKTRVMKRWEKRLEEGNIRSRNSLQRLCEL